MGRFVEGEWLTEKEWATKDGEFVRKPTAFRDRITPDGPYTPDAGRYLLGWVQEAGFVDIETTVDVWTFADPDSRAWWGDLWGRQRSRSRRRWRHRRSAPCPRRAGRAWRSWPRYTSRRACRA